MRQLIKLLNNLVKNNSFINLKAASVHCIKDVDELLKKDKNIKSIFLSGGKSLNIVKNLLSILRLTKKNNIYLTDERVTKSKSNLNSIKLKKIKNKNINLSLIHI